MAGRFFLPAVFLRGGKVLMKKREWKGKGEVIKTKDSVKKTPTGAKNKALQSAFVRETARNARQKSESVFNEASDDSQEEMETDVVYVSEYAIRKAKSRKTDKKRERHREREKPAVRTRGNLQRKRDTVDKATKGRRVKRDDRRVMEARRNVGILRLRRKFIQEKKRKTLEKKRYSAPIATEEGYSYQPKAFLRTERENNPQSNKKVSNQTIYIKGRYFREPLGDTDRKREDNAQRRSFIKHKLKERFVYERETAKINRKTEKLSERLTKAVIHTAQAFVKSILAALGGMGAALVVFVIIAAVMAVVSTSFGIFFSTFDHTEGTKQVAQIVAETNYEFNQKVREIEKSVAYDSIVYHCLPDGGSELLISNWTDVVAVFSARVSGDKNHALDVVTMDEKREKLLKETFWDMNELTYRTEKIIRRHNGKKTVKIKLHITLTSKKCSDMYEVYDFTKYQRQSAEEILKPEYAQMLSELIGAMDVTGNHVEISDAALRDILDNFPEAVSEERKATIKTAFSLVGKVSYFWGGKSSAIGWDSRWGTPKKVTAAGSNTTGMTIPYGLDCSGFVDWVFNNTFGVVVGHGGGARSQYSYCRKISWAEAQPGDLVFYPDLGHVGIVVGYDGEGNVLIVHCSLNGVVVTGRVGFTLVGRPEVF